MSVAAKLQLKPEHRVVVVGAPPDLDWDVEADASGATAAGDADAVVVFATDTAELDERAGPAIAAARRDAIAWVAYPKAGQLGTDLNRDRLWRHLADHGIRPVRQVAIDDTWSALRFRPDG